VDAIVGREDWHCYWSAQYAYKGFNITDPRLTAKGVQQAKTSGRMWAQQLEERKSPAPQSYYTSPLTRVLQTVDYTYAALDLPKDRPFVPIIMESLRKTVGLKTCEKRSTRSEIKAMFPSFRIAPGLPEKDNLWTGKKCETDLELDKRMKNALDEIFITDDNTFISMTGHHGQVRSVMRVVRGPDYHLEPATIITVLVRATKVPAKEYSMRYEPNLPKDDFSHPQKVCKQLPVIALREDGRCICDPMPSRQRKSKKAKLRQYGQYMQNGDGQ